MSKASRLVEQLETQLELAQNDLTKKTAKLIRLSEQLRELGGKLKKTEAELDALRKIKPSAAELMDVYTHFACANPIERERLAVQLALRMPEVCLRIQNLEAELARYRSEDQLTQTIDKLICERLRESVEHLDNGLSEWLHEQIKRAAHRP